MNYSEMLNQIHGVISYQMSELNGQISRLERARQQIEREQSACLSEMRKILDPEQDQLWKGLRAEDFHDDRNQAYEIMRNIAEYDYDEYKGSIQDRIDGLNFQLNMLSAASGLANEADKLLAIGDDALDEIGSKINDLQRRLF
ncbi:YwqH-like family protein [Metabacillus sp. SLBN-84]